jgi:hypothetical protein
MDILRLENASDFIQYIKQLNNRKPRPTDNSAMQWDILQASKKINGTNILDELLDMLKTYDNMIVTEFVKKVYTKELIAYYYRMMVSNNDEALYATLSSKLIDAYTLIKNKQDLDFAIYCLTKH